MKNILSRNVVLVGAIVVSVTGLVYFGYKLNDTVIPFTKSVVSTLQNNEVEQVAQSNLTITPVATNSQSTLSQTEIEDLQYLREEEKLAYDVYQALYEKWKLPVFSNIAKSELTHTTSVKTLLTSYQIADPATSQRGVYTNPELTKLYSALVTKGNLSIADALTVGATIEDLDISDLQDALAGTTNTDLQSLYSRLMSGSENHMRAFTNQLRSQNRNYSAQYISDDELQTILSGGTLTNGNTSPNGQNSGKRRGRQ